jgi:hypothetical protein
VTPSAQEGAAGTDRSVLTCREPYLAAATGQLGRLGQKLALGALQAARAMLKPEYRNLMGPGNPFGTELEAPSDATDWERFAAFIGRQPRR